MSVAATTLPKERFASNANVSVLLPAARSRDESALMPIFTLVVWIGCLVIGFVGFVLPYLRPRPAAKTSPPITAEILNVELTSDPLPPPDPTPPPPNLAKPPSLTQLLATPPPPQMISVAAPSPQIAFAVPVAVPARLVPAREASYRTVEKPPIVEAPPAPIAPQPLTFGKGEGKQPAPEYPRQALREGQEGVVTLHVTIGEDGRVLAVETAKPCAWPLLNNSALRTARGRWHFEARGLRTVEISVRFELTK